MGNTSAYVYTNGKYTRVYPILGKKIGTHETGCEFTDDVGVSEILMTDGATEFTGNNKSFAKEAR